MQKHKHSSVSRDRHLANHATMKIFERLSMLLSTVPDIRAIKERMALKANSTSVTNLANLADVADACFLPCQVSEFARWQNSPKNGPEL